ncbi:phage holin family protein [Luteimonas sp. SX5]|uniref:Phage holin family protein n=1 Tax=Luteimonas galliterrae TaxID=2940486 RepID=A0ABT0MIY2_9GAMM|nr:phage holin family protein [Luteimonas galliterrae]MCL1634829.1 phage holin family protein [Luteimonas galliterrae]
MDESVRRVGAAGKASFEAAVDSGRALRRLLIADLALARSAFGRAMAWVGVAIVFGASAWLLIMAAAIALLQASGWSWLASIALCALLSAAVAGIAAWRVSRFFDYTGLHATRRQLARLGIGDEADDSDETSPTPPPEARA